MRGRCVTDKPVHIDQLAAELGVPVAAHGADPHSGEPKILMADVDHGVLSAAVDAHVPRFDAATVAISPVVPAPPVVQPAPSAVLLEVPPAVPAAHVWAVPLAVFAGSLVGVLAGRLI